MFASIGFGVVTFPIPMSIEVEERDGVFTISGTVLTGVDVASLLANEAEPVSVIFNVAYSIVDEQGFPAGAGDIAADAGIRGDALETADGREMLAVASADLPAFFLGWRQFGGYDVDLLDFTRRPGPADAERISAAVQESLEDGMQRWRRRNRQRAPAVLSLLETPTIYYHGHDDCYFTLESRTDRLPRSVLRRLLSDEASTAWKRQAPDLPDPGEDLAASLLDQSHAWTGTIVETTPEWVAIALFPIKWQLGQGRPAGKPAYWAVFDIPPSSGNCDVTSAERLTRDVYGRDPSGLVALQENNRGLTSFVKRC